MTACFVLRFVSIRDAAMNVFPQPSLYTQPLDERTDGQPCEL